MENLVITAIELQGRSLRRYPHRDITQCTGTTHPGRLKSKRKHGGRRVSPSRCKGL